MQHALLLFFGAGRGRGKRRLRSPVLKYRPLVTRVYSCYTGYKRLQLSETPLVSNLEDLFCVKVLNKKEKNSKR